MSDDYVKMSVRELRLMRVRAKLAERRNGRPCACEHCAKDVPTIKTKKLGLKKFGGTRHQALHLSPACLHSTLAETTGPMTTTLRIATPAPR
jgi:hypothetical protein